MKLSKYNAIMTQRTPFIVIYVKRHWFLEVWTDIFMGTGDIKNNALPKCMFLPRHFTTCICTASAFHKQSKNGDVTEIQLQFTWQFDASYSHMTTHWFCFYLHADIYVKKSIRQTVLISIDWQSDNWILFTFQSEWQLDT